MNSINSYKYYDTPDGEDCLFKLWYTTKYATLGGLIVSAYDIVLVSHPHGYIQTLGRVGFWTLPFAGSAAAFTAATCISTQIRKKDDPVNYMIGGALAGAVWGAHFKHRGIGAVMSIALAVAGYFKKYGVQHDWTFFPDVKTPCSAAISPNHFKLDDFTFNIIKDPKTSK